MAMAGASFGSPMNPKEIEELMHTMNQTRIEFTLPMKTTKDTEARQVRSEQL